MGKYGAAGVSVRCRQIMGTHHATEVFPVPENLDVSRDAPRDLATFCRGYPGGANSY